MKKTVEKSFILQGGGNAFSAIKTTIYKKRYINKKRGLKWEN